MPEKAFVSLESKQPSEQARLAVLHSNEPADVSREETRVLLVVAELGRRPREAELDLHLELDVPRRIHLGLELHVDADGAVLELGGRSG